MPPERSGWRDRLGDARALVSGFGRGGGGLYDVTTGEAEAVVGHPVRRLVRVRIGPLSDRRLAPGEWRPLTQAEVRALQRAAAGGGCGGPEGRGGRAGATRGWPPRSTRSSTISPRCAS